MTAAFNAYKSIRGSLALPDANAKLIPVSASNGTPYALTDGLTSIFPLWAQQKLAAVANVGMSAEERQLRHSSLDRVLPADRDRQATAASGPDYRTARVDRHEPPGIFLRLGRLRYAFR